MLADITEGLNLVSQIENTINRILSRKRDNGTNDHEGQPPPERVTDVDHSG